MINYEQIETNPPANDDRQILVKDHVDNEAWLMPASNLYEGNHMESFADCFWAYV